ncbi:MAG: IS1634 family transposase [Actinobacteria bacterium]|nr:IS1634 family transposase [Actinomycetota bacterium]
MFLKRTRARSGGQVHTYAQIVESYWDKGKPRHRVIASLGRVDKLDPDSMARLVESLAGLTDRVAVVRGPDDVRSLGGKVYGSTWALDQLWEKVGIGFWIQELSRERKLSFDLDAALRAMVAARLHDPSSERKVCEWLKAAHVEGAGGLSLHHLYRALDLLYHIWPHLEPRLLPALGKLVAVDTSLCLFDTTSVYFEGDGPDGLSEFGYSRDRRPDRKQLLLGLLTTRDGLPVGHLTLPGSTSDVRSLEEAANSLLGRVPATKPILVLDRGMVSEANLARLADAGWQYIVGVRLRQHLARDALSRPGRYAKVSENLYVKEVSPKDGPSGERLIVCYNPLEAKADAEARMRMVSELRKMAGGRIPKKLLKNQAARRYLKVEGGRVRLDEARIKEDRRYDGRWVLRTNSKLPAVEVARHYKGLWRIERAFRTLKSPLEVHPVYHWTERRVRAHVAVCVLAYTMLRLIEMLCEEAGLHISGEEALRKLSSISKNELEVGPLSFWVRSELTPEHDSIFRALRISPPPRGGREAPPDSGKALAAGELN